MRAIAAILVMVLHIAEVARTLPYAKTHGAWVLPAVQYFDSGRIGVALFFIISGFVIPSSLVYGQSSAAFWTRRFFRLYPLFWLSIPLAVVTTWWLWDKPVSAAQVIANATMIPGPLGYRPIQGLYWTLAAELCFYVMCWLLFLGGILRNAKVLAAMSAAFALLFFLQLNCLTGPLRSACTIMPAHVLGWEWGFNLGHFSLMFLGALLRVGYEGKLTTSEAVALGGILAFWLVVFPLLGATIYSPQAAADLIRRHASYPIALTLFLILAFLWPITFRPMVWLGKVSYSLYLLHPAVLYLFIRLAANYWPTIKIDMGWWVLILSALTVGVSALTYRYVEEPANRLGARLAKSFALRSVGLASTTTSQSPHAPAGVPTVG